MPPEAELPPEVELPLIGAAAVADVEAELELELALELPGSPGSVAVEGVGGVDSGKSVGRMLNAVDLCHTKETYWQLLMRRPHQTCCLLTRNIFND